MKTAFSQAEIKVATTAEGAWLGQPGHRLLHIVAMLNGYIDEKYILGETTLRDQQSDLMNRASYRKS